VVWQSTDTGMYNQFLTRQRPCAGDTTASPCALR
jgi:hypothetical protein